MKKLILILALLSCLPLLFACGGDDVLEDETVRVMVAVGDGITVNSQNPLDVKVGEDATFSVTLGEGYVFTSVSHGTYDEESGTLTLRGVTARTTVTFSLEYLDYDLNAEYPYEFVGTPKDTTSILSSEAVKAGTPVRVEANDKGKIFLGWSFGASASSGGEIVSSERVYLFRISPDVLSGGKVTLFANYTDSNVYYYDANGGYINPTSRNMNGEGYYEALVEGAGERIKVTLLEKYYSFAECASTFWDDGTFRRGGYVLKEYNTKPDGTGEGYSLGSKFFTVQGDEHPTLYCIWERAARESEFTYEAYYMPKPEKVTHAPDWKSRGVTVTAYLGDAEVVTVPEEIDGAPVISISQGAFTNKALTTLILPKTVQRMEDGALIGCQNLEVIYYPNSIYEISDAVIDEASYSSLRTLIVNATMAPRFTKSTDGGFAVKLSRFLAARDEKKIIVISGSSTYQGLATEYMEALLGGDYKVINFGTTRPRPGLFYLEALSHYTDGDDIFIYAPENSAYMMGEGKLTWRMIRDLEGMNNLFRYVDISSYYGYFSAFAELNREYNYTSVECKYEYIADNGYISNGNRIYTDKNGDYQHYYREEYENRGGYIDTYFITFNNRYKSIDDFQWNDKENQAANKDYTDPSNKTWTSIDRAELLLRMNKIINKAKESGSGVYFGFCPADEYAIVEEAKNEAWLLAYDKLIADLYDFDGIIGSCTDYIYNHKYFYDCAFHVNDYGRAYRTYHLYLDIAELLGVSSPSGFLSCGTDFDGCVFEEGSTGEPLVGVEFLN